MTPSQAREDFICHATGSANAAAADSDGSARDMGPWQNNVHLNVTFGGAKQSAVTGKPARDLSFLSLGQWGGPGMSGKEVNITGAGESRKARVRYHLCPPPHASSPPPPLVGW